MAGSLKAFLREHFVRILSEVSFFGGGVGGEGREKHSAKKDENILLCFFAFFAPCSFLTAVFLLNQCLSLAGDTITQLIKKASLLL